MFGLSVNLKNSAHSQLSGWDFNSFAQVAGVGALCASDSGLYLLKSGVNDDAKPISLLLESPLYDFGKAVRLRFAHVSYQCGNPFLLSFRPSLDASFVNYPIPASPGKISAKRIPLRRDQGYSRFWQWKISNFPGEGVLGFRLGSLSLSVIPLGERY